jgi:sugar phosphate isomerase/epimerase
MATPPIELIATSWTSAGNVAPLMPDEQSPFDILDRVRAVAETGWSGIGIAAADVQKVGDTIGFATLRQAIGDAGLTYTEVEMLIDWWETGQKRAKSDQVRELLFTAAQGLGANHVKIASGLGPPLESTDVLVAPLRELADDAAARDVRVAIEPMPFSMVSTVPIAADLIRAVDRPNCGVLIDSWHVFRAGTTVEQLRDVLTADIVFGVELDDAAAGVVGTLFDDTINERLLCGEGTFDLTGLVRALTAIGYAGPWGVEIISTAHRARPLLEAMRVAHEGAQRVIAAAVSPSVAR